MINELGNTYGRLTVIEFAGSKPTNHGKSRLAMWKCACECGGVVIVNGHDLRRGNTTSCGCFKKEQLLKANTTHGDSKRGNFSRLYRIYANINTRCNNSNFAEFEHYGGKGVKNEFESYESFKDWAFANGYYEQGEDTPKAEMLSVDRIDTSKGYSPENCRWVSLSTNTQRRNKDYWGERKATRAEVKNDTRNDYGVRKSPHETPRAKEL